MDTLWDRVSDGWLVYSFGLGAAVLAVEAWRALRVLWSAGRGASSVRRVLLAYALAALVLAGPAATLAVLAWRTAAGFFA